MIERKKSCPKCNYHLLARQDDDIICLSPSCDWQIPAKRNDDKEIPEIQDIKEDWG